jgi:hypothetical protein
VVHANSNRNRIFDPKVLLYQPFHRGVGRRRLVLYNHGHRAHLDREALNDRPVMHLKNAL